MAFKYVLLFSFLALIASIIGFMACSNQSLRYRKIRSLLEEDNERNLASKGLRWEYPTDGKWIELIVSKEEF